MRTWTVTCFGREVVRVEMREEASVADVVRHLVARRLGVEEHEVEVEERTVADLAEGLIPCESCGEMFDPDDVDEVDEDDVINTRFADMTERLVWGGAVPDDDDDDEE